MEEVWNNGREEAIDELLDADAVVHGLEGANTPGPEGFKAFYRNFHQQFPRVHVEVEDAVSEEGYETVRCRVQAVSASGQEVDFNGMSFLKTNNGKITEAWNCFDFMTMYQQLGFRTLAPEQAPA